MSRQERHWYQSVLTVSLFFILIGLTICTLFPFLWMVSTSFKADTEIFKWPPLLLPREWTIEHYFDALVTARLFRYLMNSVMVTGVVILGVVTFCAMAGYAFARLQFRGRNLLFLCILATIMIPSDVTLIPRFLVIKFMPLAGGNSILGVGGKGWVDTYYGLIVPGWASVFGIFLLRQFFVTLPRDLDDAARIDGCSEFGIFWKIALPLCKPALITLTIFTLLGAWNAFMWPLIVIQSDELKTIQLGLAMFQQRTYTDVGPLMAGASLATFPVVLIFLILQRYFVRGIVMTGLKA